MKKNRLECFIREHIYVSVNSDSPYEDYWEIVGFAEMAGLSPKDFQGIPKGTLFRIAAKNPPRYWTTKSCPPKYLEDCQYHNCDVCGAWRPGVDFRMEILDIPRFLKIWRKRLQFLKKLQREEKRRHQDYLIWQKELDERIGRHRTVNEIGGGGIRYAVTFSNLKGTRKSKLTIKGANI